MQNGSSSLPKRHTNTQQPQQKIVEIKIKLPENLYITLSNFAKHIYSQPVKDQQGNIAKDEQGKPIPGLPQPNIETLFVTCAINTFQVYQMLAGAGNKPQ